MKYIYPAIFTEEEDGILPSWMDTLARERDINFSKLLQNAIRKECGIGV